MGVYTFIEVRAAPGREVAAARTMIRRCLARGTLVEDGHSTSTDRDLIERIRDADGAPERLEAGLSARLSAAHWGRPGEHRTVWFSLTPPPGEEETYLELGLGEQHGDGSPIRLVNTSSSFSRRKLPWLFRRLIDPLAGEEPGVIEHLTWWRDEQLEVPAGCTAIYHQRVDRFLLDLARIALTQLEPRPLGTWSRAFRARAAATPRAERRVHDRVVRDLHRTAEHDRGLYLRHAPAELLAAHHDRIAAREHMLHLILRRPELALTEAAAADVQALVRSLTAAIPGLSFGTDGQDGGWIDGFDAGTIEAFYWALALHLDRSQPSAEPDETTATEHPRLEPPAPPAPGLGVEFPLAVPRRAWIRARLPAARIVADQLDAIEIRRRMQRISLGSDFAAARMPTGLVAALRPPTTRIEFRDLDFGGTVASLELAPALLNHRIVKHGPITIDGEGWLVASTNPHTVRSAIRSGRVAVYAHRADRSVNPDALFFHTSQAPTPPLLRSPALARDAFVMARCEWLQDELVAPAQRATVTAVRARAHAIHVASWRHDRFPECIDRDDLAEPLAGLDLPVERLRAILPSTREWSGVEFVGDEPARVEGGFALASPLGRVLYGRIVSGRVVALGLSRWPWPLHPSHFERHEGRAKDIAEITDLCREAGLERVSWG